VPARLHGAATGEGCRDCPIADSIRSTYRHRPRHATRRNATQRTHPPSAFSPTAVVQIEVNSTRPDPRQRERGQHSNQIPCFTVISLRFFQIPFPHAAVAAHAHPLLTRSPLADATLPLFVRLVRRIRQTLRAPPVSPLCIAISCLHYRRALPCHPVLTLITTPYHMTPHSDERVPSAQLSIHSASLPESPRYSPNLQPVPTHLHHQLGHATHLPTHPPRLSLSLSRFHSPSPSPRSTSPHLPTPSDTPTTQPRFSTAIPTSRRVRPADLGGSVLSTILLLPLLLPCTLHLAPTLYLAFPLPSASLPIFPFSHFLLPIFSFPFPYIAKLSRTGQDRTG
jgi:hypothetical protein